MRRGRPVKQPAVEVVLSHTHRQHNTVCPNPFSLSIVPGGRTNTTTRAARHAFICPIPARYWPFHTQLLYETVRNGTNAPVVSLSRSLALASSPVSRERRKLLLFPFHTALARVPRGGKKGPRTVAARWPTEPGWRGSRIPSNRIIIESSLGTSLWPPHQ